MRTLFATDPTVSAYLVVLYAALIGVGVTAANILNNYIQTWYQGWKDKQAASKVSAKLDLTVRKVDSTVADAKKAQEKTQSVVNEVKEILNGNGLTKAIQDLRADNQLIRDGQKSHEEKDVERHKEAMGHYETNRQSLLGLAGKVAKIEEHIGIKGTDL